MNGLIKYIRKEIKAISRLRFSNKLIHYKNKSYTLRKYTHIVLNDSSFDDDLPGSKLDDLLMILLIVLSLLLVVVASDKNWYSHNKLLIDVGNFVIDLFFLAEFLLRAWSVTEERKYKGIKILKYFFQVSTIVNFLALLPLLDIFLRSISLDPGLRGFRFFRIFRVIRTLRMFEYFNDIQILLDSLKIARDRIVSFMVIVAGVVFVNSYLLWFFEHEAQPENFPNIIAAIWPVYTTMSTVGYGDVFPVTIGGKLIVILNIMFGGLSLVLVPASIFISIYMQSFKTKDEELHKCPKCDYKFPPNIKIINLDS